MIVPYLYGHSKATTDCKWYMLDILWWKISLLCDFLFSWIHQAMFKDRNRVHWSMFKKLKIKKLNLDQWVILTRRLSHLRFVVFKFIWKYFDLHRYGFFEFLKLKIELWEKNWDLHLFFSMSQKVKFEVLISLLSLQASTPVANETQYFINSQLGLLAQ